MLLLFTVKCLKAEGSFVISENETNNLPLDYHTEAMLAAEGGEQLQQTAVITKVCS